MIDTEKLTEIIILRKAYYRSNSGKNEGYADSINVALTEEPDKLKTLANTEFKKISSERKYRHGYNPYERHRAAMSILILFKGYSYFPKQGNTSVNLEELSLKTVTTNELTDQQRVAYEEARKECLLDLEEARQRQKEEEKRQKEFDALPDNTKEAINCSVNLLDDNGDYTKYSYQDLALVLASALGFCKITWSQEYNQSYPILAEEGVEIISPQDNERRFIFVRGKRIFTEIILPEIDIDKYFFKYTPYDFLGTKIIL